MFGRDAGDAFTLSILSVLRVAALIVKKAAEARPIPMGSTVLKTNAASGPDGVDKRPNIVFIMNGRSRCVGGCCAGSC